ncbi:ribonuclease H-like domain-containing protein [Tanacetum coccineum]
MADSHAYHEGEEVLKEDRKESENGDAPRRNAPADTSTINVLVVQYGIGGYDWTFQVEDGITNFALMAYTSQGSSSSDSEVRYQMRLESLEARIVVHEKNEAVYEEDIAFLNQITAKDKTGLGFDKQVNESEVLENVFDNCEKKPVLNNKRRVTGQSEEIRPVIEKNSQRVNHQNKFTHPHPKRNFVPTTVVTKLGQVPVNAAKQSSPRAATSISTIKPVNTAALQNQKGKHKLLLGAGGIKEFFDSGCSRHMTGNKSFLTDYQEIDVDLLHLEEVLKEVKLLASVLFTKTECLVLSPDFKLLDESQVLLKVPRQNNMYSFDLKNVVPSGGLTCLFAKAIIDESNLWYRRLGHINFKTMNKLVKRNLVRGLPSNLFENDHTCDACQKGKKHKASCKTKLVSSISQPLQMLHMNLFGPTSVRSINHKIYCLVVTDDYSSPQSSKDAVADDVGKKTNEEPANEGEATIIDSTNRVNNVSSSVNAVSSSFTTVDPGRERAQRNKFESVFGQDKDTNGNSTYKMFTPVNVAGSSYENLGGSIPVNAATFPNDDYPTDPLMPDLEDTANLLNTGIFSSAYDDEDVGAEADFNNLETIMNVSLIPTTRIHKDHPKDQIIGDINSSTQTRRMIKIYEEHAMVTYINK